MTRSLRIAPRLLGAAVVLALAFALLACESDDTAFPVPIPDSGAGSSDAAVKDGCVPDSSKCNSCEAPDGDPSNACSSFTGGCTAFVSTRVPSHPTL